MAEASSLHVFNIVCQTFATSVSTCNMQHRIHLTVCACCACFLNSIFSCAVHPLTAPGSIALGNVQRKVGATECLHV